MEFTKKTHQKTFKNVVEELNSLNEELLKPCVMIWGRMTPEEADDTFNNIQPHHGDYNHYNDWGNKTYNILFNIDQNKEEE